MRAGLIVIPYRLDALTIAMLAAAVLDAATTYVFLSRGLGVEMNPVLGPLAQQSLIWVPIYLLSTRLLIPAMPNVCRQSFAAFYLAGGLLFGVNNLCGILTGSFVLVDSIGFHTINVSAFIFAALVFVVTWTMQRAENRSLLRSLAIVLTWSIVFGLIEGVFYLVGRFL